MKTHHILIFAAIIYAFTVVLLLSGHKNVIFVPTAYTSVDCPIPYKDRVYNKTGVQCIWASAEMLGRWVDEPALYNPPVTSRRECQGFASPNTVSGFLQKLDVNFEQSYGNRPEGLQLIKRSMRNGLGCMFGVSDKGNRHAMVMVDWDEDKQIVKFIDSSDRMLRIQTMNFDEFYSSWNSMVLVVHGNRFK